MGLFTRKFGGESFRNWSFRRDGPWVYLQENLEGKVSETGLLGGMVHSFIYKEIWRGKFQKLVF